MHFLVGEKHPVNPGGIGRFLATLLALAPLALLAQEDLKNADDTNLLPPVTLEEAESDDDSDSNESGRHVRRLGDVTAEEWQPQFDVAPGSRNARDPESLPNPVQDQRLQELLDDLAATPGNEAARRELDQLLSDIISGIDPMIQRNELEQATAVLDVVKAIDPRKQGLAEAYRRIEERGNVEGLLAQAREAMEAGRIMEPNQNNAFYYYQAVLATDPANAAAEDGLADVQQNLINQGLNYARQLDFDSSERMLEEAREVRSDTRPVEAAEEQIEEIRHEHAGKLEEQAVAAMDRGDFNRAERILVDLVGLGGEEVLLGALRRRLEEARIYGGFKPGQIIRDHFLSTGLWTPETVVITAGSFMMGSDTFSDGHIDNESPQHRVSIRRGFAIGRREVSVAEFRQFVEKAGYTTDAERQGYSTVYNHASGRLTQRRDVTWEFTYDGRDAQDNDPVVHVSWNDARAYVSWLARGTGKPYRLPTEAEFEYALRGGSPGKYWWGEGSPNGTVENLTGELDESRSRRTWAVSFTGYGDGHWGPAPVGSFRTNPFGLYDISGNVAEWVLDCWHETYIRAPADGTAWVNQGCGYRVVRGGYWASSPDQTRSAFRLASKPDSHGARVGIRIARDL